MYFLLGISVPQLESTNNRDRTAKVEFLSRYAARLYKAGLEIRTVFTFSSMHSFLHCSNTCIDYNVKSYDNVVNLLPTYTRHIQKTQSNISINWCFTLFKLSFGLHQPLRDIWLLSC